MLHEAFRCGYCKNVFVGKHIDWITQHESRCLRETDVVNNPEHYKSHPSGVQCITITEHMGFCLGNVIKYVWRADMKGGVEDLRKARWYIEREIARRTDAK